MMKKLIAGLAMALCLVTGASANSGGAPWDKFPAERMNDVASLQNGAKLFVNYCLNCHAAAFMRYNRMRDIGLTEEQIKANLMFATEKVGDTMKVALSPKDAKDWFGANPPDLTVIARSRAGSQGSGADYLYTYLRGFYRDDTRPTGWNNTVFPSVGMPHVLWQLQGQKKVLIEEETDPHDASKKVHVIKGFESLTKGSLDDKGYDDAVADLVAFLQWMGEPAQAQRKQLGTFVLIFLAGLMFLAWRLNNAFWKDIK
jgi:ubiquinol-cytochrome c reductase cytochrome c1 subunit